MKKTLSIVLLLLGLAALATVLNASAGDDFLTLCYHDVPVKAADDPYAVDVATLVDELEYLKMHGYSFISADDVAASGRNERKLPGKSVLLTFDDGYESFYSNVVHILELYKCPAVLDICTTWVDGHAPVDLQARLLTWDHVRELAKNPLVTIASHSHDLHHTVVFNPQGNTGHAATSRTWFPATGRYETEDEYRARIRVDMETSSRMLLEKTGCKPSLIVWPYGSYNSTCAEEAKRVGLNMMFSLGERGCNTAAMNDMDRWMVQGNPQSADFIAEIKHRTPPRHAQLLQKRIIQASLDLIYDPSPVQTEVNLGRFLDRVVGLQPSTVYLEGYSDPKGDGNVQAVYFPNRVLPMRMDLLSRVVNQLYVRGIEVFVCMPVLSVSVPGKDGEGLEYVMARQAGLVEDSKAGYRRLSPFSERNRELMVKLYEDLGAAVKMHGVVLGEDGYLRENEDFSPSAVKSCGELIGLKEFVPAKADGDVKARWTRVKTTRLNDFTVALMAAVKRNRPNAVFARNMYVSAMTGVNAETRFAEDFYTSLKMYDYVVLNAYPEVEGIHSPEKWLEGLVAKCRAYPGGLDKTVFKLQAIDWDSCTWIPGDEMIRRVRVLVAAGANHVGYYPDNFSLNKPGLGSIRMEMSVRSKLFDAPARPKSNVTAQY